MRVGSSLSPLGPYLDREGRDVMAGGGSLVLDGEDWMRGPGHASVRRASEEDVLSFHYCDDRRGGLPWLGEARLAWVEGWPVPGP